MSDGDARPTTAAAPHVADELVTLRAEVAELRREKIAAWATAVSAWAKPHGVNFREAIRALADEERAHAATQPRFHGGWTEADIVARPASALYAMRTMLLEKERAEYAAERERLTADWCRSEEERAERLHAETSDNMIRKGEELSAALAKLAPVQDAARKWLTFRGMAMSDCVAVRSDVLDAALATIAGEEVPK